MSAETITKDHRGFVIETREKHEDHGDAQHADA
jgi:hypothetical protein